jgi:hypothetical protein
MTPTTTAVPPFDESLGVIRVSAEAQSADLQSQKSPGEGVTQEGKEGFHPWVSAGNIKASDDSRATVKMGFGGVSEWLIGKKYGFVLPEDADVVQVVVAVERSADTAKAMRDAYERGVKLVIGGSPKGNPKQFTTPWPTADAVQLYEFGAGDLAVLGGLKGADVNASGFGAAVSVQQYQSTGTEPSARVDTIAVTIYYTEAADPNRVCFAGRSIEVRSDGVYRQSADDEVWGPLIPEGQLLQAPVEGLEGRKARYIVIPSRGDLGEVADTGTNALAAQTHIRPAYLFAPEGEE